MQNWQKQILEKTKNEPIPEIFKLKKKMKNIKQKIYDDIHWEIRNCKESGVYPNICQFIQTEAGYNRLRERIYLMVANEGLRIDSALAQMESTL